MKELISTLIIISSLNVLAQPSGYNFGKQLLVNSAQVSGTNDFTDFVMMVNFIDSDLRTTVNGGNVQNSNGFDIVFTTSDCSTILDHQIEDYNPTTGEYIAWVKIPTLFASSNTNIHMYYGNSSTSTDPSTTAIWNTDYAAVLHMNQSPTVSILDYTANTNNGIANGGMVPADLVPGKIGNGIDFDGSNDFFDCGDDASVDPQGSLTLSAWIFSRAASGHIINRGGGWDDPGYTIFHHSNNIRIEIQRTGEKDIVDNNISINTWHYVVMTYNETTGAIRCFIDGIQQPNTGTHTGPIGLPVENLNIGRKEQNAFYFNGIIDEARVIHTFRSNDWIMTEYNNQNSSSTFYTVSPEMTATNLCGTLPVKLINFTGALVDNVVDLEWQTISEVNNDYFTVERSLNGTDWEKVVITDGAGNSSVLLSYSTTDKKPYPGISYYRLKQTDFNGQFEYSKVLSVDFKNLEYSKIELYPNPVNNQLTIKGSETELKEIIFYNLLGQNVTELTTQVISGDSKMIIDLTQLRSGVYYIKTKNTTSKMYKK